MHSQGGIAVVNVGGITMNVPPLHSRTQYPSEVALPYGVVSSAHHGVVSSAHHGVVSSTSPMGQMATSYTA